MRYISLFIILFFMVGIAWAEDWKPIVDSGQIRVYYDNDSIKRPFFGIIRYHEWWAHDVNERDLLAVKEVDCVSKKTRQIEIFEYDRKGNLIQHLEAQSWTEAARWKPIGPRDSEAHILKIFCQ